MPRFYSDEEHIDKDKLVPDWLYKYDEGITYSSTFTGGSLDIERCLNHKPCWESEGNVTRKPKTIVINDATLKEVHSSELDVISLSDLIRRLQNNKPQPFKVFFWHNNSLAELQENEFYKLGTYSFCCDFNTGIEEDIYEQLALNNIPRSDAIILGEDELDSLFDEMYDVAEGNFEYKSSISQDSRMEQLHNLTKDSLDYTSLRRVEIFLDSENDTDISIHELHNLKIMSITTDNPEEISTETISSYNIPENYTFPNLNKIKILLPHIELIDKQYKFIYEVISSTSCLDFIEVREVPDELFQYILPVEIINRLKGVQLKECHPSITSQLIAGKSLESLSMDEISLNWLNDEWLTQHPSAFTKVKDINLTYIDNYSNIYKILSRMEEPKSIHITIESETDKYSLLNGGITVSSPKFFKTLKEICLALPANDIVSLSFIHEMIESSGNLEHMTLRNIRSELTYRLSKNSAALESLKTIEIQSSDPLLFFDITLKAHNVHDLEITSQTIYFREVATARCLSAACLTYCEFTDPSSIEHFLKYISNVEEIFFNDTNLNISTFQELCFPNLVTLSLSECEISNELLISFLKGSPNIKVAFISSLELTSDFVREWLLKNSEHFAKLNTLEVYYVSDEARALLLGINPKLQIKAQSKSPTTKRNTSLSHGNSVLTSALSQHDDTPSTSLMAEQEYSSRRKDSWKSRAQSRESTYEVDFSSSGKTEEMNALKIFSCVSGGADPLVSSYRLHTFDELNINPNIVSDDELPFSLTYSSVDDLQSKRIEFVTEDFSYKKPPSAAASSDLSVYHAEIDLDLSHDWITLPSIHAREKISKFYIDSIPPDSIEIKFSKKHGMHFIRIRPESETPSPNKVHIKYEVSIGKEESQGYALPEQLNSIVMKYKSFKDEPLETPDAPLSGKEYMRMIQDQKRGVCRHRAIAFKEEMNRLHPHIKVKCVANDIHMFVEILLGNEWVTIDLGGGLTNINIHTQSQLKSRKSTEQHEPQDELARTKNDQLEEGTELQKLRSSVKPVFSSWDLEAKQHKNLLSFCMETVSQEESKILIESSNKEDGDFAFLNLISYCQSVGKDYYVINSPEDITCASVWISRDAANNGIMHDDQPGGPLHDFLTSEGTNKVILINWSNFTASDIAKYNSIIDDTEDSEGKPGRYADGTLLATDVKVIGVISDGVYDGADFTGRFDSKTRLPWANSELKSHSKVNALLTPITNAIDEDENDVQQTFQSLTEEAEHQLAEGVTAESSSEDGFSTVPDTVPNTSSNSKNSSFIEIELFKSKKWRSLLLGSWDAKGDNIKFNEGPLINALKTGQKIILRNPPIDDPEYILFWQQLLVMKKLHVAGENIEVHDNFELHGIKSGYKWTTFISRASLKVVDDINIPHGITVINPGNWNVLLSDYIFNEGKISSIPGLLEKNTGKNLSVFLSRNLSPEIWAQIVEYCDKHDVQLEILTSDELALQLTELTGESITVSKYISENVAENHNDTEPHDSGEEHNDGEAHDDTEDHEGKVFDAEELSNAEFGESQENDSEKSSPSYEAEDEVEVSVVHFTNDIDYITDHLLSVMSIVSEEPESESPILPLVIDLSELDIGDIFFELKGGYVEATETSPGHFEFHKQVKDIQKALLSGTNVILKGDISDSIADLLVSTCIPSGRYIIVDGEKQYIKGKLAIVTSPNSSFDAIPTISHEDISLDNRIDYLKDKYSDQEIFDTLLQQLKTSVKFDEDLVSYKQLEAMMNYLQVKPDGHIDEIWYGFSDLKDSDLNNDIHLDKMLEELPEQSVDAERWQSVENLWSYMPYAFMSGITGIGKSTFVEKVLPRQNCNIHTGFDKTLDWVTDKSHNQYKVLFIDEANITNRDWLEFEGMFSSPPYIIYKGIKHVLTENHKVIFAGNPLSYGGERNQPKLFEKYGGATVFKALPASYLFKEVLTPIFAGVTTLSITDDDIKNISLVFLETFQQLCVQDKPNILITPRELEMMALEFITYKEMYPDLDNINLAKYCAYSVASGSLNIKQKNKFKEWFESKYEVLEKDIYKTVNIKINHAEYTITESRVRPLQQLQDIMNVRAAKVSGSCPNVPGLGGIIYEGEPGAGKSSLVAVLNEMSKEQGFEVINIPASYSTNKKEKMLMEAFHSGAVVVVDEINSCKQMEQLLNSLLMGTTLNGEKARNPGFTIIGTQNPITMQGRKQTSTALQRRLSKAVFEPYTKVEMKQILIDSISRRALKEGVVITSSDPEYIHLENKIDVIIDEYFKSRAYAESEHLNPIPTFREVLSITKPLIRATIISKKSLQFKEERSLSHSPSTVTYSAEESDHEHIVRMGIISDFASKNGFSIDFLDKKNIDKENIDNVTMLTLAVKNNQADVVHALVESGANITLANSWGKTPLSLAKEEGKHEIRSYLNALLEFDEARLLPEGFNAKESEDIDVISLSKYLISQQNRLKVSRDSAKEKSTEKTELVLSSVDKVSNLSKTSIPSTKLYEQDSETRKPDNCTPSNEDYSEIINDFFKHYEKNPKSKFNVLNINESNLYGSTPLTVAVEKGNLLVAQALLKLGANPEIKNRHGNSAISLAQKRLETRGLKDMIDLISSEARTTYKERPSL